MIDLPGRLGGAVQIAARLIKHTHSTGQTGGNLLVDTTLYEPRLTPAPGSPVLATIRLPAPPFASSRWSVTLPYASVTDDPLVLRSQAQTLTNKTLDNSTTVTLRDDRLTLQDNGDTTKQLVLQLSNIATGTTRTIAVPNATGTLLLGDDVAGVQNKNLDATNTIAAGALGIAPTAWTPTFTQSGSVSATVDHAHYQVVGKLAHLSARVTFSAAGTAGNSIFVAGLPAAVAPTYVEAQGRAVGTFSYGDVSTGTYAGVVLVLSGGPLLAFRVHNTTSHLGADPSFAIASSDFLSFTACWEVA